MNKSYAISTDGFHFTYYPDDGHNARNNLEIVRRASQECHEIGMNMYELEVLKDFLIYVISEETRRKEPLGEQK